MPKKKLNGDEAREILNNGLYGFLGLSKADQPYVVPLNYVLVEDKLYMHGSPRGQKLDYLDANPKVCFTVSESVRPVIGDTACQFSMRYQSVIVNGTARVLVEPAEKRLALQALVDKYNPGAKTKLVGTKETATISVIEVKITQLSAKANIDPVS